MTKIRRETKTERVCVRAVTAKSGTTCASGAVGGWDEEKREGKKIGAPGRRDRLHRARRVGCARVTNTGEKEKKREREKTRHGHELRTHTHPRTCTRAKYGRLSFSNAPFSAPSAFVRYLHACASTGHHAAFSLSPSFSSCARAFLANASGIVKHLLSSLLSPRSYSLPRSPRHLVSRILPAPPRFGEN